MFNIFDGFAAADVEPTSSHRFLESVAVFGFVDHVGFGTDHLDAVLFEHAIFVQSKGKVQ